MLIASVYPVTHPEPLIPGKEGNECLPVLGFHWESVGDKGESGEGEPRGKEFPFLHSSVCVLKVQHISQCRMNE